MKGLTFIEPDGTWGIVGMNESNEKQKMYAISCKLRDYERTGLQPDDVERLRNNAVDMIREKLIEHRALLQEKEKKENDSYQHLSILKEIGETNTAVRILDKVFDRPGQFREVK